MKTAKTFMRRRIFLRNAVRVSTTAAVTGAAISSLNVIASDDKSTKTGPQKIESKGYHVSQHVLDYYRTAAE